MTDAQDDLEIFVQQWEEAMARMADWALVFVEGWRQIGLAMAAMVEKAGRTVAASNTIATSAETGAQTRRASAGVSVPNWLSGEVRWYHQIDWRCWGIGVDYSHSAPGYYAQSGHCPGTAYLELWLGPLALGVGYHWWGAQRA